MGPSCNYLDESSATGEEFLAERLISNLIFGVIGAVVMEVDLHAQHMDHLKQSDVIRLFKELIQLYIDDNNSDSNIFLI